MATSIGEMPYPSAESLGAIDRTVDLPPYRQIAALLRSAIRQQCYRAGDRLPSESALIAHFGVARMTVRQAMQQLKTDGLVHTEHGRGAFVRGEDSSGSPSAGPLNLDDVVALAAVIERITGRALSPDQSSALKNAYQAACSTGSGATLLAVAESLARSQCDHLTGQ